jgi:beta-glucosidase
MEPGGAVAAGFWRQNADAILVSFYGGEQTAPGVFNILYGQVNPSGKLPISFPETSDDYALT